MVDVLHCRLSRRSKIKAISNLCYVPFRWPQCRALTPPNGSKNVKKNTHLLMMVMQKWYNCLRRQSGSFLHHEHDLTPTPTSPAIKLLCILSKERNIYVHAKNLYKDVYNSFTLNAQTWKQQISLANEQNSKLWYIWVMDYNSLIKQK